MDDDALQEVLHRIWWPYCEPFLAAPQRDRLTLIIDEERIVGRIAISSDERSTLTRLADDYDNRFNFAFQLLCRLLDPYGRAQQFVFGERTSPLRVTRSALARGRARLSLLGDVTLPLQAAKRVKKKAPSTKAPAPKKTVKAKATKKPAPPKAKKAVTKKPPTRRK